MRRAIDLLDEVALTADLGRPRLKRGQVGTVVDVLEPDVYLVEFSDDEGRTYALASLRDDQVMLLHHKPVGAE